jgi:hypothetical protein
MTWQWMLIGIGNESNIGTGTSVGIVCITVMTDECQCGSQAKNIYY